jgi:hypothetical protein
LLELLPTKPELSSSSLTDRKSCPRWQDRQRGTSEKPSKKQKKTVQPSSLSIKSTPLPPTDKKCTDRLKEEWSHNCSLSWTVSRQEDMLLSLLLLTDPTPSTPPSDDSVVSIVKSISVCLMKSVDWKSLESIQRT